MRLLTPPDPGWKGKGNKEAGGPLSPLQAGKEGTVSSTAYLHWCLVSLLADDLLTLQTGRPSDGKVLGESLDDAATRALHEGVRVGDLIKVAEGVVDATVGSLISSNVKDEILHGPVTLGHVPVADSNVGDAEVGVRPPLEVAMVELKQAAGVGVNGLFLKIADEAVANLRREQV